MSRRSRDRGEGPYRHGSDAHALWITGYKKEAKELARIEKAEAQARKANTPLGNSPSRYHAT